MRYVDMEKGFQYAFSAALRAYKRRSTAIGCAIMNGGNECVAIGENSICANDNDEKINNHNLAHTEINAIFKAGSGRNADVSSYTLYTTMEPCIMCFGAIVMCYYKSIKFAALDPSGGATNLNKIKQYGLNVEGPFNEMQEIQVALTIYRGLKLGFSFVDRSIGKYKNVCDKGIYLAEKLYNDTIFNDMMHGTNASAEFIIDYMFSQRNE